NVDPLVAVLGHRRRIAGPVVVNIFVHGSERAQIAIGAFGHVDDRVPFLLFLVTPMPLPACGQSLSRRRSRSIICRAQVSGTSFTRRGSRGLSARARKGYFAGTRFASFSVRLISLSLFSVAKAADRCSVRPSHGSICTSALEPASEWVVLVCVRSGVSRL